MDEGAKLLLDGRNPSVPAGFEDGWFVGPTVFGGVKPGMQIYCAVRPLNQSPTSDLQKSRHLQKSRVTERHNRGTKRKLKSHQAQKKALAPTCFANEAISATTPYLE